MPGFLYFAPGQNPGKPESLEYAFEGEPQRREISGNGPTANSGVVFADSSVPSQYVGYFRDRQKWRDIPNSDLSIGWYPDNPPTEETLRKSDMLDGYLVDLGNGERWKIPIARTWNENGNYITALPCVVGVNSDGQVCRTDNVVAQYRSLWETATRIFEGIKSSLEENSEAKLSLEYDSCFEVIAANYRVSAIEIAILELVTTKNSWSIAHAVIDLLSHPFLTVKKNEDQNTSKSDAG